MKTSFIVLSTIILTLTAVLSYLFNVVGVGVGLPFQGYLGAAFQTLGIGMIWATGYMTALFE